MGAQDGNKKRGCKQERERKRLRYRRRVTDAKRNFEGGREVTTTELRRGEVERGDKKLVR